MIAMTSSNRALAATWWPRFNLFDGAWLFLAGALAGKGYLLAAVLTLLAGAVTSGIVSGLMAKRDRVQAPAAALSIAGAAASPSESAQVARIVGDVLAELDRSTKLFPTWPTDPIHASHILLEEAGEVSKAVNEVVYEPHKATREDVQTEALQTGAMAIRFLMSVDRYEWTGATQHVQLERAER